MVRDAGGNPRDRSRSRGGMVVSDVCDGGKLGGCAKGSSAHYVIGKVNVGKGKASESWAGNIGGCAKGSSAHYSIGKGNVGKGKDIMLAGKGQGTDGWDSEQPVPGSESWAGKGSSAHYVIGKVNVGKGKDIMLAGKGQGTDGWDSGN